MALQGPAGPSAARRRRSLTISARSMRFRSAATRSRGRSQARPTSPWARDIAKLWRLRGIDTLTAVGLCAEIQDFTRFEHPKQLMSYIGLVPSEKSSGQSRRQGAITKSRSGHARRLLVEAAWHYRRPPRIGPPLKNRQQDQPAAVIATAWKAQQRLHHIWRRLDTQRSKRKTLVAAAVARHLVGSAGRSSTPTPTSSPPPDPTRAPPHPQPSAEEAAERAWPPRARASARSL